MGHSAKKTSSPYIFFAYSKDTEYEKQGRLWSALAKVKRLEMQIERLETALNDISFLCQKIIMEKDKNKK